MTSMNTQTKKNPVGRPKTSEPPTTDQLQMVQRCRQDGMTDLAIAKKLKMNPSSFSKMFGSRRAAVGNAPAMLIVWLKKGFARTEETTVANFAASRPGMRRATAHKALKMAVERGFVTSQHRPGSMTRFCYRLTDLGRQIVESE